ncbi:MAG TPA: MFS transporter [Caulobacteraceae bacterium]|jgi:MHS family alpha-ketoglutarate permease-like MFS transporter|nr:MFS transporter [Caulobacteraceae bacterium]
MRPADSTAAQAPRLFAIMGGAAGNFIEWYDWFAYSSFSLYFAAAFFPASDELDRRLQAAAVFAVGFLARPAGAWLMGVFADRHGRKAALTASVAAMCGGSALIALTPSAHTIGVAAPVLLTLARLIQGLSIGGEYGASAVYISEMAGRDRRGFWSSFQFVTLIGGQIAALAVLILLQHVLTDAQLQAWGWRIPFWVGAGFAVVVWLIQSRLDETDAFKAERGRARTGSRTGQLLRDHRKETAMVFVLTAAGSLTFYSFTTYMQKFLTGSGHFSKTAATNISAASLVIFLLVQPLFGVMGDRFGRRAALILAFAGGAITTVPILTALSHTTTAPEALFLVCAALFFLAPYTAVNAVVKAELFPTGVRGIGVALPYALANALFGGTAELVAETFRKAGLESGFFVYVSLVAAAALLVAVRMREVRGADLTSAG